MALIIKTFEKIHISLVKEFNGRIKSKKIYKGGIFPESNIPTWTKKEENSNYYQEYFLAFYDNAVRGGYILKHIDFIINKKLIKISHLGLPLSEGIVNSKYAFIGIELNIDAAKRSPNLFAMGMGGYSEKLPQLLKKMKWKLTEVPFHFTILNSKNFLLNISYLRKNRFIKIILNIIAFSGIGNLAINSFFRKKKKKFDYEGLSFKKIEKFDEKFDSLWKEVNHFYYLIAVRDRKILNKLYGIKRFNKLEVYEKGNFIGWVIVLNTKMHNHKQFGDMQVGSIVDCLSSPSNAIKIINCATEYLIKRKADIIVLNHANKDWNKALKLLGYFEGPSNYLFAPAPELAKKLEPFDLKKDDFFITRGDGDGPINL